MKLENIVTAQDPNLTLVFLVDTDAADMLVRKSAVRLGEFTVWIARCETTSQTVMIQESEHLLAELDRTGFKRASLVALDRACAVAQIALAQNAQIVRRAIFVNPQCREETGAVSRFFESIQGRWPLPLPVKLKRGTFDIRHLQHRVACPLIIVQTGAADALSIECCNALAARAPSSWHVNVPAITSSDDQSELGEPFVRMIREFIEVPAKRSQKNLGGAKAARPQEERPVPQKKVA